MKKEKGKGRFVFNMLKRADEATDVSIEMNLALLPPLLCRLECVCDCVCLYVDPMMNLQLFWGVLLWTGSRTYNPE